MIVHKDSLTEYSNSPIRICKDVRLGINEECTSGVLEKKKNLQCEPKNSPIEV